MRIDKDDFTSLISRLAKYGNNFVFLMLNFVPWIVLLSGIAILLGKLAEAISIPSNYVSTVLKILLCIIPLFPTMRIWKSRDEFGGSHGITDGIMDCCFTTWVIIILLVSISL